MSMISIEQLYKIFLRHPEVTTDSRKIAQDSLFFALKGDHFNGNKYATNALEKGAAYAIIDEAEYQQDDRFLLVKDVLTSLQVLANHHRRQFSIPIIGITGTNGKTTTKELLNAVLSNHYPTHCTKGNFNNHIGVPLTLLNMKAETAVAIIEMGANHVGEIDFLCQIAEPTHGLITNVGKAHLEGFGSFEGVKKAKSELYRYLQARKGSTFINLDEAHLEKLSNGIGHRICYLKSDYPNPVLSPFETKLLATHPFVKAAILNENKDLMAIQSRLSGSYNFNNIMTAISVGRYFKVPSEKIKTAIENYTPSNNRSQILEQDSNTYILDAYNANPSSMAQSLENFSMMETTSKIAILGDMLELGKYSFEEHQKIYEQSQQNNFNKIILVGKEFGKLLVENGTLQFENVQELKIWFEKQQFKNQYILLKGSRGIQLEQLLKSNL